VLVGGADEDGEGEVVIVSSERSSFKIVAPPDTRRTIGVVELAGTEVRRMPRVSASASA
jgi:hypothetical protein